MKNSKQRNLVTDQNQNWTKGTTFKSWKQKLRHETEIEVTRQKLTHLFIPLFNFYSNPARGRDTITGNRARPGEVTQVPLSPRAVLSTSILPSKNNFLSFFAHEKGLRHISLAFGILVFTDILNYPKTGSLAKKSLLVCGDAEKEKCSHSLNVVLLFNCGSDLWLSVSSKFLCVR